ncbi:MAG: adenylate/guanylate cyclase domain-containing protein [Bacteroidota bacterium]|nr:adenylate/guanylate cyclase domain-containing protein [Bacteroidota bacterium]
MQRLIFLVYIVVLGIVSYAQDQQLDSLKAVIAGAREDTNKVKSLLSIASHYYRTDPSIAIQYGTEARDLAKQLEYQNGVAYAYKSIGMGHFFQSDFIGALVNWERSYQVFESIGYRLGMANMLNNLGAVYYNRGDNNKAIEYYVESLRVSEEIGDTLRIATALVNIGAVYYSKKATHDMALKYYSQALPLSEALGDQDAIGTSAVNMGQIYLDKEEDESALYYFQKALEAYRKSETGNVPYALLNMGRVYAFREDFITAINYQIDAFKLAENNGAKLEMAQALLSLADTYDQKDDLKLAIETYRKASDLSSEIGASYVLKDAYDGLAQAYAKKMDYVRAFNYQSLHNDIKDTLYNSEMDKRIEALTLNFEIEKQQGEINLLTKDKAFQDLVIQRQKIIRNAIGITGILLLLLAGGIFNRYRFIRKTNNIIAFEKDRSDRLLLNVLPEETAEELKEKGSATPRHYDMVSVLFTDFKGFTKIAEKLTPRQLVEELDNCFLEFDRIIDKHNLEKIKTIGDAYMCAGGIPAANTTNPIDVVKAGLEIKEFMENLQATRQARGEDFWELRIGIHTGPVIAGVVGKNKFAYDIWGDAVNIASRMESSGIPGKVNISGKTYDLIKDHFRCMHRGQVEAKNKGAIDMYLVESFINSVPQPELVAKLVTSDV